MSGTRERLTNLLITLWEEDAGESLDGLDGVSEAIDAYLARLLPVVDRIANERAAAELRAAADDLASVPGNPYPLVVSEFLNGRADALDPT